MALVAVHAVVHIPLDAVVVRVGLGLGMAIGALENRVVVRIRMARRTHAIRVAMVDRERRVLRVIERCIQPVRGVMAVLASRREELRLRRVSRVGRAVIVGEVARNAQVAGQIVVIVDVAI